MKILILKIFLGVGLFLSLCLVSKCFAYENHWERNLLDAINSAENSAAFPYGIKSVDCGDHYECRNIALNTIRNNMWRYLEATDQVGDYLKFLSHRYAPPKAPDDPDNLNANWYKNVRYFYGQKEKINHS